MSSNKTINQSNASVWFYRLTLLVFFLILYTSISRLLNWEAYMGFLNYRVPLLLDHLGLSAIKFHLEIDQINSWVTLVSIFSATLLLVKQMRYLRLRSFWMACLPLIGLLLITGLSRYWSVAPGFTFSRFNLLFAAALGGVWIGLEFQTRKLRTLLEVFAVILVVASLITMLIKPELNMTFDPVTGIRFPRWFGIFGWKMPAGMMMGFAVVMFLFRLLDFKIENWFERLYSIFFFVLSLVMMFMTRSMTEILSVIAVIVIVGFGALYIKWGKLLKPVHWWTLGGMAVVMLIVVWVERGFILDLIGKDENFTGRIPMWISFIPVIKDRLLFGYGFGEAFWKVSEYYQPIWDLFPDILPKFAHNGFIEALMDTGLIGFLLWIIFLVQVAYLTLQYFFRQHTLASLFFFSWFVFMVVMNIGNNHLGSYETFTWLMLVISFAAMVRENIDLEKVVDK